MFILFKPTIDLNTNINENLTNNINIINNGEDMFLKVKKYQI